jgi:cell division protein FtsZ
MRLKDKVDALVVIPNDRIFSLISKETPIMRAFGFVDDVLKNAVEAIAELINSPGIINVDFADIKAILKDSGATMIGIGLASGADRSVKAVNAALNSPLLEITIDGAKGVLFSVAGGRDLKMAEIHDIAKAVSANLDPNARVIFGAYHDRGLKDKALRVTVIATGFSGMLNQRMTTPTLFTVVEEPSRTEQQSTTTSESRREKAKPRAEASEKESRSSDKADHLKPEKHDSWEIPAFLRKKRR